jgi:hypothetical protein
MKKTESFYNTTLKWWFVFLFLIIMGLTSFKSYSLSINGSVTICSGETGMYSLTGTIPNTLYTWTVYKLNTSILSTAYTIMLMPNNHANIQWLDINGYDGYTISVTGGGQTATYDVLVLQTPNPFITTDNRVGCQKPVQKDDVFGFIIVDDQDGCVNVCEHSTVNYTVHGLAYSYFEWNVTGGVFSNGLTTISGLPNPSYLAMNNVAVTWDVQCSGNLTVIEHSNFIDDCPSLPKTVCVNIIERPNANFSFINVATDFPEDQCYDICLNQTVYFTNLSTGSYNSPLVTYEWDFGDNVYSQLENPSHQYTSVSPTGSYTVKLKVTNICGCTHTFQRQICVSELEGPVIKCPSVVCENHNAIYSTEAICNPYFWSVTGGHIVSQTDPEVTILWDNVGPDGFGSVSLDGNSCNEVCPFTATIKVPVIQAIGTIAGSTDICVNKNYKYTLPAWPATNFVWSFIGSNGSTFVSHEENSYEVWINTGSNTGTFTLKCTYVNTIMECSGMATININVSNEPVILNPPEEICINNASLGPLVLNTSIAPTSLDYIIWTVKKPNGTNPDFPGVAGSSSISISATTFASPGLYIIKANYTSGLCDPEEIRIKVKDIPPTPTFINGESTICPNYPYSYNGDLLQGTVINWTITGGHIAGSTATTATSNSIAVIWNFNATSRTLTVSRTWDNLPGCNSAAYIKTIYQVAVTGNITGNANPCEDATENYTLTLNNVIGESYLWKLNNPALGSISQAQGSTSCAVTWNHTGAVNGVLYCDVIKCGTTNTIAYSINIKAATTISSFTPATATICSGDPTGISFNATTSGAAPASSNAFEWDFGDGSSPIITTTNQYTYHYTNFTNTNQIYTVSVKVKSSCNGAVSAASFATVTVKPQPNASISPGGITWVNPPPTYSLLTTISNTSANGPFTYQWYFIQSASSDIRTIDNQTTLNYTITNIPPVTSPVTSTNSQGQYWAVVTNTITGCTTKTNIRTIMQNPNPPNNCTPLSPYGINNLTATLTGCGQISATSNTLGTYPGNIISYVWSINANGASFSSDATLSDHNTSPVYTISKPGIYQIQLEVTYQNSIQGQPPCVLSSFANIIVPLIADFKWGITCNGFNNGYNIILNDNSPVYGNMPVTYWEWKINGGIVSSGNSNSNVIFPLPTSWADTYLTSVQLTVSNANGNTCVKTFSSIYVPDLPLANFNTATTNLSYPTSKSCEGREVIFTNASYPLSAIVQNIWDFGDNTELHALNGLKVYVYSSTNPSVILIVTDKYGCSANASQTIHIDNNGLSANNYPSTYTLNPPIPPCLGQQVNIAVGINGGTPNSYKWFRETLLCNLPNTPNVNVYESGAYWVQLGDANYCIKDINPIPALVSFKQPPTAIIEGKKEYCYNDETILKSVSGVTMTNYLWAVNPGSYIYTTKEINLSGFQQNNYTAILTVSDNQSGCITTSAPYPFTVHNLPPPATLSVSPLDCNTYQLQLQASTSVSPAYFNWSDGQTGQAVNIYHGGAYCLWLTDQYGCLRKTDKVVAEAPETYFWRFPEGCYTFCPGELPKWVDSDKYKMFDRWEWYFNGSGNVLPDNGYSTQLGFGTYPYEGNDNNCITDRMLIDLPANAMGSGDYSWMLDNGLCAQESGIMNVNILESCCDIKLQGVQVDCISNGLYSLQFDIDNNTPGCPNGWTFNLSITDPFNMSIGSFSNTSPNVLYQGITPVTSNFQLLQYASPVKFKIEVFCNSYETCIGFYETDIPECGDYAIFHNPENSEKPAEETDVSADLHIMPNPANSQLSINYCFINANTFGKKLMKIFDATGRPVKELTLDNNVGTINMDVSHFAQGIYFIELCIENLHIISKRLLINH